MRRNCNQKVTEVGSRYSFCQLDTPALKVLKVFSVSMFIDIVSAVLARVLTVPYFAGFFGL